MAGTAAADRHSVRFGRPVGSKCSCVPEAKAQAIIEYKAAGWRISDIVGAVELARGKVTQWSSRIMNECAHGRRSRGEVSLE